MKSFYDEKGEVVIDSSGKGYYYEGSFKTAMQMLVKRLME